MQIVLNVLINTAQLLKNGLNVPKRFMVANTITQRSNTIPKNIRSV